MSHLRTITHESKIRVINDPSLRHLDLKIAVWIISCIMIGLALAIVFPSEEKQDQYIRSTRVVRPGGSRLVQMKRHRKAA